MPMTRASAAAAKSVEPEKSVEIGDQAELGMDNDMDEIVEEEVEYEVEEEELEERKWWKKRRWRMRRELMPACKDPDGGEDMKNSEGEEDAEKKHAELLALTMT